MATNNPQSTNRKRTKPDFDTDSDSEVSLDLWPRFLIIESTDENKPLSKLSPFALYKAIQGIAGTPKEVKRLRSGTVLLEVTKEAHSKNLLRCKKLIDVPVKISEHRTLNTRRGVVYSPELKGSSEEEILEHLAPQVKEVRRIKIKREGRLLDTNSFILTFASPALPSQIKVAYLVLDVRPYVASPLRCFKCQKYGHHKNACRQAARCARCGSTEHPDGECSAPPRCVNCEGEHTAFDKDCPVWKKEKSIQKIKAEQNIPYLEARKSFETSAARLPGTSSYAQAVATPVRRRTYGTQTDLSWPEGYRHPETIKFVQNQQKPSTSSRADDEVRQSPPRRPSERVPKGANDPIRHANRFSSLEDFEDDAPIPAKGRSDSGSKPIKNTDKIKRVKQQKTRTQKADVEPMELATLPDGDDVVELVSVEPDTNPVPPNPKRTSATRQRITPP
jgi:hypothetical protein